MTQDPEMIFEHLTAAFGGTVHHWPDIPQSRPRWWMRQARSREAKINAALTGLGFSPINDHMRAIYWRQVRFGQDIYEDAGGYCWRCWRAALGLPFREPSITYSGYVAP